VETVSTGDPEIDLMNSTDWSAGFIYGIGVPCYLCGGKLFAILVVDQGEHRGSTRLMCCHECQEWSFREGERLVGYLDGKEYLDHGIPWVISAEEAERRGYTPKRPKPYRAPFASKEVSDEELARHREEQAVYRRRGFNWWELKRRRAKEGLPPLGELEFNRLWGGEAEL
jgi:hypothetical protein